MKILTVLAAVFMECSMDYHIVNTCISTFSVKSSNPIHTAVMVMCNLSIHRVTSDKDLEADSGQDLKHK